MVVGRARSGDHDTRRTQARALKESQAFQMARGIFVHCLPRVCSTWLAYKFRDLPNIGFRFEPLHPNLIDGAHATLQQRFEVLQFGRSLRHPLRPEHYHTEYEFKANGGLQLFQKRFCYESYYMEPDEKDVDLSAYLRSLWTKAATFGAVPFFKCTKSALRGEWICQRLPGTHIYIFRDPRLMDTSNFSFRGYSSPYIRDYALIVGQNSNRTVFAELAKWCGLTRFVSVSLEEEYSHYRHEIRDHCPGRYDRQFHFSCLVFFWFLALGLATRYADLVIDMDMLREREPRLHIEELILGKTGIKVNLSDYRVDEDRLRRALCRHSYPVAEDVLEITRNALTLVGPCWSKIEEVPLTPFTRELVELVQ